MVASLVPRGCHQSCRTHGERPTLRRTLFHVSPLLVHNTSELPNVRCTSRIKQATIVTFDPPRTVATCQAHRRCCVRNNAISSLEPNLLGVLISSDSQLLVSTEVRGVQPRRIELIHLFIETPTEIISRQDERVRELQSTIRIPPPLHCCRADFAPCYA